jgi:hypothetical protein
MAVADSHFWVVVSLIVADFHLLAACCSLLTGMKFGIGRFL